MKFALLTILAIGGLAAPLVDKRVDRVEDYAIPVDKRADSVEDYNILVGKRHGADRVEGYVIPVGKRAYGVEDYVTEADPK
ncbi:hypothetical protein B0I37DRAFT_411444 [Chaetomium sp. MPI-CAGE-AT-0009]|nr:hypothetical protein B0I37DRAFT_411444 [Chaetomium sp. MPI-CAGE-AT-0009]